MEESSIVFPASFPVLETERLVLREVCEADAPIVFRLRSDAQVMRYSDREPAKSIDEAKEYMEKLRAMFANREAISWCFELRETGEYIGNCGVFNIRPEHRRAMFGYVLLPEFWGKGYTSEAVKAIVSYVLGPMNFHSMDATINPENKASARVLEKAGFRLEGKMKENCYFRGKFRDTWIYGLVRGEEQ